MSRTIVCSALVLSACVLAACSSLNPFSSSKAPPAAEAADASKPAPPKRQPESMGLQRFDANADGSVVRQELEDTLAADFKKEDANGDQALDVGETRALNERLRKEKSGSPVFDWNADGRLEFTEFASQWRTLFQRSDIDRDDIVDERELNGAVRENKPRPLPKPDFSGKDGRPPGTP